MVLKFIYLGKCVVGQYDLQDFLTTGNNLGVEGLMEDVNLKDIKEPVVEKGTHNATTTRIHSKGKKPTGATEELTMRRKYVATKFNPAMQDRQTLSDEETRCLVAKVIEIAVLLVVRNHMYSWRGTDWMQTLGVPTGLHLSGIIGRITMDVWAVEMDRLMMDNHIKKYLFEKYVDDSEILMENMAAGSRWSDGKIVITQEAAEEDIKEGRTKEEESMLAWGDMASSIIPGLVFTVDFPARHTNNRVPVLDFELWCEEVDDRDNPGNTKQSIKYSFYEKDVTRYKIQDTRCIFRASVATLSGLSTEKSHEQVLLKSIKNLQVQVIGYMNAGDDEIETLGLL